MIDGIRAEQPDAAFRSSFIVGFPGETEPDHDELLAFLADGRARLGRVLPVLAKKTARRAATLDGEVDAALDARAARASAREVQDPITAAARDALVGQTVEVLVDGVDDDGGSSAAPTAKRRRSTASSASSGPADVFARRARSCAATVTGVDRSRPRGEARR